MYRTQVPLNQVEPRDHHQGTKLLTMAQVNEEFPILTYKVWKRMREKGRLSISSRLSPSGDAESPPSVQLKDSSCPPKLEIANGITIETNFRPVNDTQSCSISNSANRPSLHDFGANAIKCSI